MPFQFLLFFSIFNSIIFNSISIIIFFFLSVPYLLPSTLFLSHLILLHRFSYHPSVDISKTFFFGLQLPFAICLWNKHYTILITWISTRSAWTLFWNAMCNFYIDDVIKSISFGLLTQVCHRAKENESPFRRLEQGLLGCSQQGLPVSSGNSWQIVCLVLSPYTWNTCFEFVEVSAHLPWGTLTQGYSHPLLTSMWA